ncbi:hypothetical protein TSUD_130380, partial [Trifolium subterraneum]
PTPICLPHSPPSLPLAITHYKPPPCPLPIGITSSSIST